MQNNCIGRSYSWKCRISAVEAGSVQADGKNNGVRAFALEGDYGGCEQVNRYIHGGEGTAQEAAAAIGFSIYRTEEMAELISYMRQYNESALEGEDLRFYGLICRGFLTA